MTGPDRARVRIDRIIVETDHPVDGFALQLALGDALREVVAGRGVPRSWQRDGTVPALALGQVDWDGRGGAPGLARAVAERLHAVADAQDGPGAAVSGGGTP